MTKTCDCCDSAFIDGETLIAIVRSKFKQIPSKVHFSISLPDEVMELFHEECFYYEFGPKE